MFSPSKKTFVTGCLVLQTRSQDVKMIKKILLTEVGGHYSIKEEISLNYDYKLEKLIIDDYILPCLLSDNFCKPTLNYPYTIFWFPEEICAIVHISDFIGRMSKLKNCFCSEPDDFLNTTGNNTKKHKKACCQLYFLLTIHHWELLIQIYQDVKCSEKKNFL